MAYPPSTLPTNAVDGASPDDTTPEAVLVASEVNATNAAINDIVAELGSNPSGASADVAARLTAIEAHTARAMSRDLWAIGDSITDNGNALGWGAPAGGAGMWAWQPVSYLAHAALGIGARLVPAGVSATFGYTAAQIRATHLPNAVAARPAACVVLAGANGVGLVALASILADITGMWDELLAVGTVPVACTIPPQNTTPGSAAILSLNSAIRTHAARRGIPLADFYSVTVDEATGQWRAGMSGDGVHPSATGAAAMGSELSRVINARWPAVATDVPYSAVDALAMIPNQLMLTDAGADGVADGWSWMVGPGTSTATLAVVAGCPGKMQIITRNDTNALLKSPVVTLTSGHRYRAGMHVGASPAGAGTWTVRLEATTGAGILVGFLDFPAPVASPARVEWEFVAPSGLSAYTFEWRTWARDAADTVLRVGAVSMVDLTAAGLE